MWRGPLRAQEKLSAALAPQFSGTWSHWMLLHSYCGVSLHKGPNAA